MSEDSGETSMHNDKDAKELQRDVERRPEYEYKTVEHSGEPPLEDVLNEHGSDGWRFVDLLQYDSVEFAVFERVQRNGVISLSRKTSDDQKHNGLLRRLR